MIIIRNKDANQLSSVFTLENGRIHFSSIIDRAKDVDIIFFDKKINAVSFRKKFGPTMSTIGELERRNLPFILLVDKKSEVNINSVYTAVINADCISYDTLEPCFPERGKLTKRDNKALLLSQLVMEYADYDKSQNKSSFETSFYHFVKSSELDDVFTKDVLFVAMDAETGNILNANEEMGKLHDDSKVWSFSEEYLYDEDEEEEKEMVIKVVPKISIIDEFTWMYETQKSSFSMSKMKGMTVYELTEIITKYPTLFTDILKRKVSWFLPAKLHQYEDMYEDEEDLTESEDRFLNSDELVNEEYFEVVEGESMNMRVCFGCENFIIENQTIRRSIDGKIQILCDDCDITFPRVQGGF